MENGLLVRVKEEHDINMGAGTCRLCDKISEQTYDIFDRTEGGKHIFQMIKEVLPIVIYSNDPLPKQICDLCYENLETSYQLRTTTLETLSLQKERLRNAHYSQEVDLYLQTVENREIRQNGGFPESTDVATETVDLETSEHCKCCSKEQQQPQQQQQQQQQQSQMYQEQDMQQSYLEPMDEEPTNGEYTDNEEASVPESTRESVKRSLEESPSLGPTVKRRRIGPKSLTTPRNILENVHYEPLTLLQCTINAINKINIPDFEVDSCKKVINYQVDPICLHCGEKFDNINLLALHEASEHIKVNLFDRVDDRILWNKNRPDSDVRNKWLKGSEGGDDESLLEALPELEEEDENAGVPKITLIDCKPYLNGVPLASIGKEARRQLYKTIMVQGIKRKFCHLCRFTFKDNWAIELHYFSSACYFTCRFCGIRFNKQRQLFHLHVKKHIDAGHKPAKCIYAARKKNDPYPKILKEGRDAIQLVQDDIIKSQLVPKVAASKPRMYHDFNPKSEPVSSQQQQVSVKKEPGMKNSNNQAYFCRRCYKVFFKFTEFNVHVKNCNGSGSSSGNNNSNGREMKEEIPNHEEPTTSSRGSATYSSSGRPIRNCVREVATYNDNIEVDHRAEVSTSPLFGFQCTMCSSVFPSVQSRNSHMRIHKSGMSPTHQMGPMSPQLPQQSQQQQYNQQQYNQQFNQHQQQQQQPSIRVKPAASLAKQVVNSNMHNQTNRPGDYSNMYIKQEPMEPEVEIHETHESSVPSSIGNVSITMLPRDNKPKKPLNPDIMRLVQNNPSITLHSMSSNKEMKVKQQPPEEKYQNYEQPNHSSPQSMQQQQMNPNNSSASVSYVFHDNEAGKMYRCSSCSKPFSNKSDLYFHKKNQCGGSKYPCPFCKKRFGTESAYSSHIFYSHPE